ncbi:MAG: hypothetical protein C5B48_13705 [Candidatus Rokuibacteriota bacterium]|nr:MAG: hypothetical protein C5B48_13705 [Candidatus Rokubacteria bacterium]
MTVISYLGAMSSRGGPVALSARLVPGAVALVVVVLLLGNIGLSTSSGQAGGSVCDLVASVAGNNTNPGTLAQPVRTVQRLIDMLGPGQTGCLRGTPAHLPFVENVSIANKNQSGGSEANRITIESYPGEVAKIKGTVTLAESANFVTLSQLVIEARTASSTGNVNINGDNIVLSDNNVSGGGIATCIRIGGTASVPADETTLLRNRIHDCVDGVLGAATTELMIDHNLIYDGSGWGIRLQPNVKATGVVYNILDNNSGGGLLLGGDATNTSTGAIIDHDVFSNSGSSSWNVSGSWTGTPPPRYSSFVTHACSYDPNHASTAGINNAAGGFLPVTPIVNQDPQYTDASTKNFHIPTTSPCYSLTGDIAQSVDDGGGPNDEEASANQATPNILLIVTDDQRENGTITQNQSPQVIMPQVVDQLKKMGTYYSNAFSTTPLCCPARAGIMSGSYAHNTLVASNSAEWNFKQDPTMEAYLHDEGGYHTGIFGKYLNVWDLNQNPAHWDEWSIFNNGYCPFVVNDNGTIKDYGKFNQPNVTACGAYSTTYVQDKATSFIDAAESNDSQPWLLYLAPFAPHGPATPEDKYANTDVGPFDYSRSVYQEGQPGNTADPITDKPDWVQGAFDPGNGEVGIRQSELRSLLSVDDMVGTVLKKLQTDGEQDTMVVYVGDNGFEWGEHGILDKQVPYTDAVHVPLIVRYPPITIPGTVDSRLAANIDIAPTALKLAGLSTDRNPPIDGLSLFDPTNNRNRLLLESWNLTYPETDPYRAWASTRTPTYQYIESYNEDATVSFHEYYDLVNDPDQQFNCYGPDGQPGGGDDLCSVPIPLQQLHDQLFADRLCVGTQCPPGPGAPAGTTDTTPPAVQMTQPTQSGYVSGVVKLKARALDNFGVTSVQFMVDGSPVGPPATIDPPSGLWDTTGVPPGQHSISAVATDAAGNQSESAPVTVNLSSMDVQVNNGSGTRSKPDTGDTITYSFGRPVNPGTVQLGWNGTKPVSCAAPAPPGCVTVGVIADDKFAVSPPDTDDTIKIFKDPSRTATDPLNQQLTSLGLVDTGSPVYVGATGSWLQSPMELVNNGTAVQVTLGNGSVQTSPHPGGATMLWAASSAVRDTFGAPFCVNCTVFESVFPWVDPNTQQTINDEDPEF